MCTLCQHYVHIMFTICAHFVVAVPTYLNTCLSTQWWRHVQQTRCVGYPKEKFGYHICGRPRAAWGHSGVLRKRQATYEFRGEVSQRNILEKIHVWILHRRRTIWVASFLHGSTSTKKDRNRNWHDEQGGIRVTKRCGSTRRYTKQCAPYVHI